MEICDSEGVFEAIWIPVHNAWLSEAMPIFDSFPVFNNSVFTFQSAPDWVKWRSAAAISRIQGKRRTSYTPYHATTLFDQ